MRNFMIFILTLLMLSGCTQLPKGEVCTLKEVRKGGSSIAVNPKNGLKPILIMHPNTYCYECSDGVTYCINRKER